MRLRINEAIENYKETHGKITKTDIAKKLWVGAELRTQKSNMNNLSQGSPICVKIAVLEKLCEILKTSVDELIY